MEITSREAVALRLRKACKVRGIGPTAIGEALEAATGAKVSQQRVSMWLKGTLPNDPNMLMILCRLLGIDANYLMEGRLDGLSQQMFRALSRE